VSEVPFWPWLPTTAVRAEPGTTGTVALTAPPAPPEPTPPPKNIDPVIFAVPPEAPSTVAVIEVTPTGTVQAWGEPVTGKLIVQIPLLQEGSVVAFAAGEPAKISAAATPRPATPAPSRPTARRERVDIGVLRVRVVTAPMRDLTET
jgi:hypothetical protein